MAYLSDTSAQDDTKHSYTCIWNNRVISDDKVLDKFLFTDEDVRKEIIGKCGISTSNYHVGITKLKKAGFFINGGVNPKFVPKIDVGATKYSMILLFTIPETNEESGESTTQGE